MATLQCEIVTPERKLYSEEAGFVVLPGSAGEMGVLPGHAPTVTTLDAGRVDVRMALDAKDGVRFLVAGGYAQVETDRVIILADRAIDVKEIDFDAAQAEAQSAKSRLAEMSDDDPNRAFAESEKKWNELLLSQR